MHKLKELRDTYSTGKHTSNSQEMKTEIQLFVLCATSICFLFLLCTSYGKDTDINMPVTLFFMTL